MEKLTYRQAYDKIIEAYFKDEIEPLDPDFCFCGTLCNNNDSWQSRLLFIEKEHNYSFNEYGKMEQALFSPWYWIRWIENGNISERIFKHNKDFEDKLFEGMSAALDVLKQIHKDRGENVDEDIPAFTKRKLANAL